MEKPINERLVAFSGKATIPKGLSGDVTLKIMGGVVKEEDSDNQDGTKDTTFKVKLITVEIL